MNACSVRTFVGSAVGVSVGGASVAVVEDRGFGSLTLLGTINSFAIGGLQLEIFDVSFIPEPASALVLLAGFGCLMRRRRRN